MADRIDFRRAALGVISLSFIGVGLAAFAFGWNSPFHWVLMRSGLFMGAVWLALPDLTADKSKLNTQTLLLGIVLVIVIATRPKLFMILGLIAIAAFFLQGAVRRFIAGLKR